MYYLFTVCVIEIRSCEIVFSKSKMCMHSMCGSQASYQVSRANQLASGCGTQSISDVLADVSVPEATPGYLADGEDITRLLLQTGKTEGPALNPCSVQMPKAAVLSFHTWHERAPGIVGILLGSKKKNSSSSQCISIVVGSSFEELLASEKVKAVCSKEDLYICGVITAGRTTNHQDRERIQTWTSRVRGEGSLPVACIMATWKI